MRPLTDDRRDVGELSPDTTVVLLLCGRFGKGPSIEQLKGVE
jgi:hypothetical protein